MNHKKPSNPVPLFQRLPNSGSYPNQGQGLSEVGLRDVFMDNTIIMRNKNMYGLFK